MSPPESLIMCKFDSRLPLLCTLCIVLSQMISRSDSLILSESSRPYPSNLTAPATQNDSAKIEQAPANASSNSLDAADEQTSGQVELESYWLMQRDLFFNQTTFNLTKSTSDLVGAEHGQRSYHLPYWFDYDMYRNLTDRTFNDTKLALKRHHIYVDNCLSIWKSAALKRLHRPNNYTFIDHAEDWVSVITVNCERRSDATSKY